MPSDKRSRNEEGVVNCATTTIPKMDGDHTQNALQGYAANNEKEECTVSAVGSIETLHHEVHQVDGMSHVQQNLRKRGISAAGADIIMFSWRPVAEKQYQPHVNSWIQFYGTWHINSLTQAVTDIVNYLFDIFQRGVGYDSVNMARGALSSLGMVVDSCRVGNHPLINRLLRGLFNLRPLKLSYVQT